MSLEEIRKAEEAEAKREGITRIVVLIATIIVGSLVVYAMTRPQPQLNCNSAFSAMSQQQGTSLTRWGGCS